MQSPLAYRMRPQKLTEIVGQQHLVQPGKILWRMVQAQALSSMILYGPPGTGKTSIANALAQSTNTAFRQLNAATDSKKQLQIVAEEAKMSGHLVLLLDEIHRLDKTKQDFLLPLLESGQIILIGATTENPYITINPAIRSRTQIFEVYPLKPADIKKALQRALQDKQRGLGNYPVHLTPAALDLLAQATAGDLRSALNGLELAVKSTPANSEGVIYLDLKIIKESIQNKAVTADKNGDEHYNVISALQKSIRGSDTNAALHYLARLLEAGDLQSIIRRVLVTAYEDIGLANPAVCQRAVLACQVATQVGLPEARIPLADTVIELCLSPKSNSGITAIDAALKDLKNGHGGSIPNNLKDTHYKGAHQLNHGQNYLYPHDYPNDWVAQQYLPEALKNKEYYQPKTNGKYEQGLKKTYDKLTQMQRKEQNFAD
ncbi:replication-associated recombination protein A [Lactobacillus sp. W8089]|nr:replication-associated recombination protein A [Lactobacillus sp. W8086]MBI0108820.1 replication-associated recombination protein A [Lactobacillus sp. W8085]MBI0112037.1 replication-associated recombination protein A [Lactobacillus sp. W8088]MBI0115753.1 replication-associated recombination protein A [Lactobacillus sp. W8087]MBI0119477.1 replication-associated recombination protein A [Lactobacillus sp. W8089]MBI0131443.1 replication-associated recombination protein A [Lactobacillus sp. W809